MRYVENNLRLNEHIVAKAKISWTVTAMVFVRALIMLAIGFAIWSGTKNTIEINPSDWASLLPPDMSSSITQDNPPIIINLKQMNPIAFWIFWGAIVFFQMLYRLLKINAIELVVTDRKIVGKTGIIWSKSVDAYLEKIDYFIIHESLFGRLFNYAVIEIGTTASKIKFDYISNANDFKNVVMDCIDRKKTGDMNIQARMISSESLK